MTRDMYTSLQNLVSTGNCQRRYSGLGEANLFWQTKPELKMVVYSLGSCNVMRSIESLISSEEVSTSSITGSPTGYWNLLAAPDRLPKLVSCPCGRYIHVVNRNPQKILNRNYHIEDTAHKRDGTSKALQKQEAASDSLSCGYNGNGKSGKKLWVWSPTKKQEYLWQLPNVREHGLSETEKDNSCLD